MISTDWDPVNDRYGALPFIYGTLVSSTLALMIAVPLSLGVALCLSEMAPVWLSRRLGFLVELLAAIPERGIRAVGDFCAGAVAARSRRAGSGATWAFCRFFKGPRISVSMFTRGVVLAIMVMPYIAAVCTDVFAVVPQTQREAALALGATTGRWCGWRCCRIGSRA